MALMQRAPEVFRAPFVLPYNFAGSARPLPVKARTRYPREIFGEDQSSGTSPNR